MRLSNGPKSPATLSLRPFLVAAILGASPSGYAQGVRPSAKAKVPICPDVEVVFCMDTTGSMGGLIEGAKARIWGIINGIVRALDGPRLKVGLVDYKDRGDAYVTRILDLTDNLESVQARLATFFAAGGGDEPESVNQALADSVGRIHWTPSGKPVYRAIFLVGDAPPHMDYPDDVKHPVTCQEAVHRGIVINAIQCGNSSTAKEAWLSIATGGRGGYAAIPQSGGVRIVSTPYDAWLAEFSAQILSTAQYVGPDSQRSSLQNDQKRAVAESRAAVLDKNPEWLVREADRSEFRGKAGKSRQGGLGLGSEASKADLVEAYLRDGIQALRNLRTDDLPEDLRKLSPTELEARIKALAFDREGLIRQVQDLSEMRETCLEREKAKRPERAFDDEVLDLVRRQAALFCH